MQTCSHLSLCHTFVETFNMIIKNFPKLLKSNQEKRKSQNENKKVRNQRNRNFNHIIKLQYCSIKLLLYKIFIDNG